MRSIQRWTICFFCLALLTAPLTTSAQDKSDPAADADAMMQKWMEFMTPGKNHELLKRKVGKWNLTVKMWMEPNAEPEVNTATAEYTMVMDGRYLVDKTKGEFQGMPFEGMGTTGYDNGRQKFVSTWIDSMGTGIMTAEGDYDPQKKQWNFNAVSTDPMTGKQSKSRSVERIVDDNTWVMESYNMGPDGKEFKSMEITYKRQ